MPASQSTVTQALTRRDAKQFFLDNCGEIYREWTSLIGRTTLPEEATSSDQRILDVLLTLDTACRNPSCPRTVRLASIQLARVLSRLKNKVKEERRRGVIDGKRCKRDASIVIDIYCKATGKPRAAVLSLARLVNRCSALGRDSLLAVTLTDHDAKILKNTSIPIRRLETIAEEITRLYPPELVLALNYLSNDGMKMASDDHSLMLVRRMLLACPPWSDAPARSEEDETDISSWLEQPVTWADDSCEQSGLTSQLSWFMPPEEVKIFPVDYDPDP